MVWHKDSELPDGLILWGSRAGFRSGITCAAGRLRPTPQFVVKSCATRTKAVYAIGCCNGFQVLTETGLLPGALLRNAGLKYICKTVGLRVETSQSAFTERIQCRRCHRHSDCASRWQLFR